MAELANYKEKSISHGYNNSYIPQPGVCGVTIMHKDKQQACI